MDRVVISVAWWIFSIRAYYPLKCGYFEPEGSYEIGFLRPSFRLSVRAFSWNCIISFLSKFWQGVKNRYEVRGRAGFSGKDFFAPKIGKFFFLNLLTNSAINFYAICSLMKIYIIYCVPAQIASLGKFLLLR